MQELPKKLRGSNPQQSVTMKMDLTVAYSLAACLAAYVYQGK